VDLTQALPTSGLEISFDHIDFNDPATGYQSTATITPTYDGKTPDGPVAWSVDDVVNPSEPWWLRGPNDLNGLTWGAAADAASYTTPGKWSNNYVEGAVPTGPIAQLTDVVGSRTVKVKAVTTVAGVPYSKTFEVRFGPGPLSIFTSAPTVGLQWAVALDVYSSPRFTELINPAGFPAAAFCGGEVHTGSLDIAIGGSGPSSYTANFTGGINLNHWREGDVLSNRYYSTTSKLPTLGQLMAVSAYNVYSYDTVKRKGAALAAGWPDDAMNAGWYSYWAGQVNFDSYGYFYAGDIGLSDGSVNGHYVTDAPPVVVCVQ
jgi:hypothetical protein